MLSIYVSGLWGLVMSNLHPERKLRIHRAGYDMIKSYLLEEASAHTGCHLSQ